MPSLYVLIERITEAIFRQEDAPPDYPNPGNLRDAPWFSLIVPAQSWPDAYRKRQYPDGTLVERVQLGKSGWFWKPRDRAEGEAGALHVVALHVAELQSIRQFIPIWAPPNENATEKYIQNVANWSGVNPEVPVYRQADFEGVGT